MIVRNFNPIRNGGDVIEKWHFTGNRNGNQALGANLLIENVSDTV